MAGPTSYAFLKGHGTENDFVLLPDPDGTVHGDLAAERVRALCDRRAGIGGDGVLRVVRTAAYAPEWADRAEWFMDYRNADGSLSEMCGNGVRVFARHLLEAGLVEPSGGGVPVATRAGLKIVYADGDSFTADMGHPKLLGTSQITIAHHFWSARHVDMGNPHAVAFVESLDAHGPVGPLLDPPVHDEEEYPDGVNVEFVVRRGDRHVAMRVHERGSGETRSCGTGACAVMVAAADDDGVDRSEDVTYTVDVPGGTLRVTWTTDDRVLLTGPAVIVAEGQTDL
ncbi:diaminopimelate epimerase [Nocardioides sp. KR10-350]|uniref:diaminopimelate epimerase n=1 Tax=Nocardioides cheoyonin TaxID=3156615 RepID=UPI0032B514FE